MLEDTVLGFGFEQKENISFRFKSGYRLTFLADDHYATNAVLVYSADKLEAATYRPEDDSPDSVFWSNGAITQPTLARLWADAYLFYSSFLEECNKPDDIASVDWDSEGFGDILETLEGDFERFLLLQRNKLKTAYVLDAAIPTVPPE